MNFNLEKITRPNIKNIIPYSTARDEFSGNARVFLDANENALGSPLTKWYNRYPDPHQAKVKAAISSIKNIDQARIFLGNGSDECIDLLYRCFCRPGIDNVIICPPTYGMYEVSANINDVKVKKVSLLPNFQLDLEGISQEVDENTRLVWICSPNNPTGNSMDRTGVEMILNNFNGLVVIDEAYINFSRQRSFIASIGDYPNLVVLQTFSKAWGLAGLRLGMAFASEEIISIIDKAKPPYNISQTTQDLAVKALSELGQVNDMIREIVSMRQALIEVFETIPIVEKVFPSDSNFILVKVMEARRLFEYLLSKGIVVRDRSNIALCENCLRITIGTEQENTILVDAIADYLQTLR
jgi:histidinol-phosphate aminotransferase